MSSTDDRIVRMVFDNASFKKNAKDTEAALTSVNKAVDQAGSGKGLMNLDRGLQSVSLSASKMSVVTTSALATLASKATSLGLGLAKKLGGNIFDTILGSGKDRAIAIEQAQFQFRGLGLNVKKVMDDSLYAVKGTAFGLQEAASAAAQFGGSGLEAGKQMRTALRSISGIAAQSGRSFTEISQVMTGIAGVGRVTSQDLMQFGVRGINVAVAMAKQMHLTEQQVRQMVSEGKIGFKEFATMMDKSFGENATKSNETYTGSLANLKAALSRIGADFQTAKLSALKNIFNALTPAIDKVRDALGPVVEIFSKRMNKASKIAAKAIESIRVEKLMKGLANIISPFANLVNSLISSLKYLFRGMSGGESILGSFGTAWYKVTEVIAQVGKLFGEPLETALKIVFATIRLGIALLRRLGSQFSWIQDGVDALKKALSFKGGDGGFGKYILSVMKSIQRMIETITDAVNAGTSLKTAFSKGFAQFGLTDIKIPEWLSNLLSGHISIPKFKIEFDIPNLPLVDKLLGGSGKKEKPLSPVQNIADTFKNFTGGTSKPPSLDAPSAQAGSLKNLTSMNLRMDNAAAAATKLGAAIGTVSGSLAKLKGPLSQTPALMSKAGNGASSFGGGLEKAFGFVKQFAGKLKDLVSGMSSTDWTRVFNIAVLAGAGAMFWKIQKMFSSMVETFNSLGGIGKMFGDFGESLKNMTKETLAEKLKSLALALLLLAGALWILSKIPIERIGFGLGAMSLAMVGMVKSIQTLSTISSKDGPKMGVLIAMFIGLGLAMILLAKAVQMMGTMKLVDVIKGVIALRIVMIALNTVMTSMSDIKGKLFTAAASMVVIAGAMYLFAGAIFLFSKIPTDKFLSGMGKIALALASLVIAVNLLSGIEGKILSASVSMIAMSVALYAMAGAILIFARIKPETFANGMEKITRTLLTLVIAAVALGSIKGKILSASIGINLLTAALYGLSVVILIYSAIPWDTFVKGMLLMGIALGVLIAAGYAATAAATGLLALGASIALIGLGVGLAAAGLGLLAIGLVALGAAGVAAMTGVIASISLFLAALPLLARQLVVALVAFATAIGDEADTFATQFARVVSAGLAAINRLVPQFIAVGVRILLGLINGATKLVPAWGNLIQTLIDTALKVLRGSVDSLSRTALGMLNDFLDRVHNQITGKGGLLDKMAQIVVDIIEGGFNRTTKIMNAWQKGVTKFLNDAATSMSKHRTEFNEAARRFAEEFAASITSIAPSIIGGAIEGAFRGALSGLGNLVPSGLRGLLPGGGSGRMAMPTVGSTASDQGQADGIDYMGGVGVGLTKGLVQLGSTIGNQGEVLLRAVKKVVIGGGPEKKFMDIGAQIMNGLSKGIIENANAGVRAISIAMSQMVNAAVELADKAYLRLQKQASKAQALAQGKIDAANRLAKRAKGTKTKKDDKAAKSLRDKGQKELKAANKEQAKANARAAKLARGKEFQEADSAKRAAMRSEDAQNALKRARKQQQLADRFAAQAKLLAARGDKKGAAEATKKSKAASAAAKNSRDAAKQYAQQSYAYQAKSAEEAAAIWDKQYKDEAEADAEQARFDKMSDADKAAYRKKQAETLQKQADDQLAAAKKLAKTDLEGANDMAQKAMEMAEQAREYQKDAESYAKTTTTKLGGGIGGTISLDSRFIDSAYMAADSYLSSLDASLDAMTGGDVIFQQYNSSPEALSTIDIYRQTSNLTSKIKLPSAA